MTRILFTDLGVAIYVLTGVAAGITWERRRRGGSHDVRAQRNRLYHQLRRARTDLATALEHPAGKARLHGSIAASRHLFSVGGGKA